MVIMGELSLGPRLCRRPGEPASFLNNANAMSIRRDESQSVVQWTFLRGNELLTCQVHRQRGGRYRLSVVPHATAGRGALETFSHLVSALHRHAAVAAELRQQGWTVVRYSTTPRTPTYLTVSDAAAA
jgi:hypothetical protein